MGYGKRNGQFGNVIQTFWPDDTNDTMHLDASQIWSLTDINARIQEKWPGASTDQFIMEAAEIQTDCIGFDRYDPIDWTAFIIIRKI